LTRADDGWEEIFVWKRAGDNRIRWNKVGTFVKVLVVLGFFAFIYQNLRGYIEAWFSSRLINANPDVSTGPREVIKVGHDVSKDLLRVAV
jgi:type IV secretory pathway TrbL component